MNILREKQRLLPLGNPQMGGGGGGGGPTQQQTTTTDLPEWARPYAKDILAKGQALTDIQQNPYQTYDAPRIAGFSPMQEQAFTGAANLQPSQQGAFGSQLAGLAGLGALGTQYQGGQFGARNVRAPYLQQYGMQAPGDVTAPTAQAAQLGAAPTVEAAQMQGPAATTYEQVAAQQGTTPTMQAAQTGYAPDLQTFQMGPAERVGTQSFTQPGTAADYMNPYMQNVVDIQKREAQRASDIQGTQQAAQAVKAGAFGGSRAGIVEAERQRNLAQQLGDIQATGSQAAYNAAQQQFNAEQARALQAAQGNQQAGLTTGQQNLAAQLGVQQLGTQTGLQTALQNLSNQQQAAVQNQAAQLQSQGLNQQQALQAALANQQAGMGTQQFNAQMGYNTGLQNAQMRQQAALANQGLLGQYGLQQGQFGQAANVLNAQQGLQAALANQQMGYNVGQQNLNAALGVQQLGAGQNLQAQQLNQAAQLQAQQLAEQSRQYGAGLGMQGLQTGLQAAGQLGSLGAQQFGQQQAAIGLQNQLGTQQQQLEQQGLSQAYQDFLNQQNYPYRQLGFMSDLLRGTPTGSSSVTNMYQAPPTMLQNLAALGAGAYGMSKLFNAGGSVKTYAGDKGSVTSEDNVKRIADMLPTQQLPVSYQNAARRADMNAEMALRKEMAERQAAQNASIQNGLGSAFNALPAGQQNNIIRVAGGGIVAFSGEDDSDVQDPYDAGADGSFTTGDDQSQTNDGSPGMPSAQASILPLYTTALNRLANTQEFKALTPAEQRQAIIDDIKAQQDYAGPSPYEDYKKELAGYDKERAGNLERQKGLAAVAAIPEILKGNDAFRGLGGGAAAWGAAYGQALQADRQEKMALGKMKFTLADAQRKENLGMYKEARASAAAAQKYRLDAYNAGIKRDQAIANAGARGLQATRPAAQKNAPQPKLDMTLYQNTLDHLQKTEKPQPGETSDQFNSRIKAIAASRAMAQAKTTDMGPARLSVENQRAVTARGKDVQNAVNTARWQDPEYQEAIASGNTTAQAQALDRLTKEYNARMYPQSNTGNNLARGSGSGGGIPTLPPGFKPVRN